MYSTAAKQMVAGQIMNMLGNNVIGNEDMESFLGWIEDGDAYYNAANRELYTDEQIKEAIRLSVEIAYIVDELSWKLNTSAEECGD